MPALADLTANRFALGITPSWIGMNHPADAKLAARNSGADLSPSLQYWRSFACKYLSERCLLVPVDPQNPVVKKVL